jgi:Family of unknown function (DUF5360)
MTRRLSTFILVTDIIFLAYWTMSLADVLGLITVPASLMYSDYDQPLVVAWNWSFFPTDVIFSLSGLLAVRASRKGSPLWLPLAIVSLCFTIVAGLMAISYWILLLEFEPGWFLPNLALVIWPLFFLPGLIRQAGGQAA